MRTIAHLSDLHFGRIDETLLDPLRRRLEALRPDLVVVSGDLTQRARAKQSVDGSHDLVDDHGDDSAVHPVGRALKTGVDRGARHDRCLVVTPELDVE